MKDLIFLLLFLVDSQFVYDLIQLLQHIENICHHLFFGFIVTFFNHLG